MNPRRILVIAVLLAGSSFLMAGCRYQAGFLIPADVHSVHVKVASNETFWHEALKTDNRATDAALPVARPAYTMEIDLTERVKNEIVRRTPLKLANERSADTILAVSITRVEPQVLLRDAQDDVLSERVTINVGFTWTDRRNGRVLAKAAGLSRPTDFNVARAESFTTATRKSFDHLAQMIVERMQERF